MAILSNIPPSSFLIPWYQQPTWFAIFGDVILLWNIDTFQIMRVDLMTPLVQNHLSFQEFVSIQFHWPDSNYCSTHNIYYISPFTSKIKGHIRELATHNLSST